MQKLSHTALSQGPGTLHSRGEKFEPVSFLIADRATASAVVAHTHCRFVFVFCSRARDKVPYTHLLASDSAVLDSMLVIICYQLCLPRAVDFYAHAARRAKKKSALKGVGWVGDSAGGVFGISGASQSHTGLLAS